MFIAPNKTILQGKVLRVRPDPLGWGCNLEVAVESSAAAEGAEDFIQARPGGVLEVFSADKNLIEAGKTYELTARVLGGPNGERVVLEDAHIVV